MRYFSKVENGVVVNCIVSDTAPDGDWIETFRGSRFGGVGKLYSADLGLFTTVQPYPSWSLDQSGDWQPPTLKPEGDCDWDEESLSWISP